MKNVMAVLLASWIWLNFTRLFAADSDTAWIRCIEELPLPRFGPTARGAGPAEGIKVQVELDSGARLRSLTFDGGLDGHHYEIGLYMKAAKFTPSCAGRRLELKFSFVIKGEKTYEPWVNITFRGPNHFVLTTPPARVIKD